MKQHGVIKEIVNAGVIVLPLKKGGCGHCAHCSEGKNTGVELINIETHDKFEIGDKVVFEISDSKVFKAGLIIYLFPLIVFFLGYFIMFSITKNQNISIFGSLVGIGIAFILLSIYDKVNGKKNIEDIIIYKDENIESCFD